MRGCQTTGTSSNHTRVRFAGDSTWCVCFVFFLSRESKSKPCIEPNAPQGIPVQAMAYGHESKSVGQQDKPAYCGFNFDGPLKSLERQHILARFSKRQHDEHLKGQTRKRKPLMRARIWLADWQCFGNQLYEYLLLSLQAGHMDQTINPQHVHLGWHKALANEKNRAERSGQLCQAAVELELVVTLRISFGFFAGLGFPAKI